MTLHAVNSSNISPPLIVALGIVAFTFNMFEAVLDISFPPHKTVEREKLKSFRNVEDKEDRDFESR